MSARGQLDPGDAAGGPPLGAHLVGPEAQQLCVGGDEDQLLTTRSEFGRSDDVVAGLERDRLPLVAPGRVVGRGPLDDPRGGAQREAGGVRGQRQQGQGPLALAELDETRQGDAAGQVRRAVRGGQCRQVERRQPQHPPGGRDQPEVAAGRRRDGPDDRVVARALAFGAQRRVIGGPGEPTGAAEQHEARVVADLQRHRGGLARRGRGRARRLQQHGATRGAELLGDLGELGPHECAQRLLVGEQLAQRSDLGLELALLRLQLEAAEFRQPPQLQVEDVVGLRLRQVEDLDEPRPRRRAVVAAADERDDLVDGQDRDEQPLDEVQPLLPFGEPMRAAPPHDLDPEVDVDGQQLPQPQGARLPVDERDVVDPEAVLQRGQLVELLQDGLGVEAVLDLDDQVQPALAVGEVLQVADALELLGPHELLDLRRHLLRPDEIRQLGDDDSLAARGDALDPAGRAGAERAPPRLVGVADALEPDDPPAAGQIGARHVAHEVGQRRVRMLDEVAGGGDDLGQVVRRHVRRHPDGDAGGTVDQKVRVGGGHHRGLGELVVVVGDEVDRVLVQARDHRQRRRSHPRLGIPRRRRPVVEGAEVAVSVDEVEPHREGLGHPHERVVDRAVAVRVVLAHDVTDDAAGLHVAAVGPQPHLVHPEQDPPLHWLEPVTRVGQRPGVDDRVGVFEERPLHLLLDVDVDDPLLEALGERGLAAAPACHAR